ncbi:hypothetical protein HDU96_010181 [Phlyctochytrium bullatum]|nr:hypothetical protein HDU96_010181 [Phlyctochytrium bullatum]
MKLFMSLAHYTSSVPNAGGRKRRRSVKQQIETGLDESGSQLQDIAAKDTPEGLKVTSRESFRKAAQQRVAASYAQEPAGLDDELKDAPQAASQNEWYVGKVFNAQEVDGKTQLSESASPMWKKVQERAQARELAEDEDDSQTEGGLLTVEEVLKMLDVERGRNISVLDVSGKCDWTETMIVVEGRSKKQIFALVDGVRRMAKRFMNSDSSLPPTLVIEGANCDDWMVLDLGRIVLHAMTPEARQKFDIEGLWTSIPSDSFAADHGIPNEDQLLSQIEKAWAGRPLSSIKTKQIEAEDIMDEAEMLARIRSGEVLLRSKK